MGSFGESRAHGTHAAARVAGGERPTTIARVLGRLGGPENGPALICVAAIHGNEPSGVVGMQRVFETLGQDSTGLVGQCIGLVGNRQALAKRQRFVDIDLNRAWSRDRVERVRSAEEPLESEDRELRELDRALQKFLAEADEPVSVLDLHSTSGPGPAFGVLDDSLRNREFALAFPVPLVLGLEEEIDGTLFNYLAEESVVRCLAFEAGQHDDPLAASRAEAAIWIALEASGVLRPGSRLEVQAARDFIEVQSAPRLVEVKYRHAVDDGDKFEMVDGFASFQSIGDGEIIAADRHGEVRVPFNGLLLMPKYQQQGDDGYFLVRRIHPLWFRLSILTRRVRLERSLHWLPGVARHPHLEDAFVVDRGVARWLALELFHLLGYRRHSSSSERVFVVSRRD